MVQQTNILLCDDCSSSTAAVLLYFAMLLQSTDTEPNAYETSVILLLFVCSPRDFSDKTCDTVSHLNVGLLKG